MATEKGRMIAEYAKSKIGCAYIYGGYGEKKCTPSFRKERAGQYPDQKDNIYKNCPVLSGKRSTCEGCKWNGKQSYDCAQLTRYSCKAAGQELVSGANSQWNNTAWAAKGKIDTLPDVPGVILYHANSSGRMTHTGVCIGGGQAVEARAAKYGVVQTTIKDRTWTHWAALPGVLSGADSPTDAPESTGGESIKDNAGGATAAESGGKSVTITLQQLRNGDRGEQAKTLQRILNALGHNCGAVDGIIGSKTVAAVKAFQKASGLTVDGIVGAKTWAALLT